MGPSRTLPPPIACSPLPALVPSGDDVCVKTDLSSPVSATSSDASAPISAVNLALFLNKDRKQNSACDACRVRKVKCVRTEDDSTCTFCISKNVECTRYYMALATEASSKRAATKKRKRQVTGGSACSENGTPEPTPFLRMRSRSCHDLQEGMIVQVRSHEKGVPWEAAPHRIQRIVYRPVAVVLDIDDATPIGIDHVRAFESASADPSSLPATPSMTSDAFSFTSSAPVTPVTLSPASSQFFTESFARPSHAHDIQHVPGHAYAQEWQEPSYVTHSPSMASLSNVSPLTSPGMSAPAVSSPALSQQSSMIYSPYMTQPSGYFGASHQLRHQPTMLDTAFAATTSHEASPSSFHGSQMDDVHWGLYPTELQPAAHYFRVGA